MDTLEQVNEFKRIIEKHYHAELMKNVSSGNRFIEMDFRIIAKENVALAELMLEESEELLKAIEIAIESFDISDSKTSAIPRIMNIPKSEKVNIRDIRSKHLERLIYIEGIIKTKSSVRPQVTSTKHECPGCGNIITVLQLDQDMKEPTRCGCGRKGKFKQLSKELIDVMTMTIEEDVAEIEGDSMPQKILVILKNDLTDPEKVIDLIPPAPLRIIGIPKETPIIKRGNKTSTKIEIYIDVNNIELIEDSLQRITFTPEDIDEFKKFSKKPQLLDKLRLSVAPHLAGHDRVKEAILLFIVKGVKKKRDDGIISRDYFHILLIGDPGCGKSDFGKEVNNISFKSKIAVGKGASGVGLTGSAEKDELLGERVLTAGTIPTCNQGHVIIDEVDKMDDEVQSHLLDCMESGQIRISKSKVQGILKANVSIFMIANPKKGRFNEFDPIAPQISLSQPLISRFDLIFPIIDSPNVENDKDLFEKILAKHRNLDSRTTRPIEFSLLRKYLFYVSQNIQPKITDEAETKLYNYFEKMRGNGNGNGNKTISITPRQIEGLIRISEAYAKLRMSDKVLICDVEKAISLVDYYLECFALDHATNKIDIDRIQSGISSSERNLWNKIKMIIAELEKKYGSLIPIEDVVKKAKDDESIPEEDVESSIERLKKYGDIMESRPGFVQRV